MDLSEQARQRLKQAREVCRLSQAQAATAINKSRISVARWESGDRSPHEEDVRLLAELYSTEYEWIINGIGEAPTPTLARKKAAQATWKKMRILQEPLLQDVPDTAPEEFKAIAQANARGTAITRLPREFGPKIVALMEAEEKAEPLSPSVIAQAIESIAGQLRILISLQTAPMEIPGISSEIIKAISDGQVIPAEPLRKTICAALGIDEARLLKGDLLPSR
ncbi:MAG: Helix-turn-helix domain [Holophagaceae bacterium]|nr:Helix-turn-helix domain [Holophagaceae bacterium]